MIKFLTVVFALISISGIGQTYTSYHTGSVTDTPGNALGGICLMGGASENDNAMIWFLNRANGGDVLVLRASGSDGYNSYMYSTLGVTLNSVETIVCNSPAASYDAYVIDKISKAEAIWFAGGDQWDYISYWRNTPVDSAINAGILNRNIAVGGTSAGMAIQGGSYFSAQNGTVSSAAALSNPFATNVTVDHTDFINHPVLDKVITDTHYDNPDRRGRQVVFLARMQQDFGTHVKGIACDEYTAVCIDNNGIASVYGEYPSYDDFAYFIQSNCELTSFSPEDCSSGNPLDWDLNGEALKVFKANGTVNGSTSFNLNDWQTASGGEWQDWSVDQGTLVTTSGTQMNCATSSMEIESTNIRIYPNPTSGIIVLEGAPLNSNIDIYDSRGRHVARYNANNHVIIIDCTNLDDGIYSAKVSESNSSQCKLFSVIK